MKRWQLDAISGDGVGQPRVLFSTPEARAVVSHLRAGEEMGAHRVRERAIVQVVSGRVAITCGQAEDECPQGALVVFEPGEEHAVRALEDTEMLLLLVPWPAPDHYPQRLPRNASEAPAGG